MDKKALINSRILKFPLNIRTDKIFLVQPKINLQSFKSTPDSLKQHLTALERKRSLGAPGFWHHVYWVEATNPVRDKKVIANLHPNY